MRFWAFRSVSNPALSSGVAGGGSDFSGCKRALRADPWTLQSCLLLTSPASCAGKRLLCGRLEFRTPSFLDAGMGCPDLCDLLNTPQLDHILSARGGVPIKGAPTAPPKAQVDLLEHYYARYLHIETPKAAWWTKKIAENRDLCSGRRDLKHMGLPM